MARSFDTIRAAIVEEYMRSYMASKNCDAVVMLKQPSGQVVYRGKSYFLLELFCFFSCDFFFLNYSVMSYFSCFDGEVAWWTDYEI